MSEEKALKKIDFIGSSREERKEFPDEVKQNIGYALYETQMGQKPAAAKPLKGFSGAGVLEIVENSSSGTYRAVYTARFQKAIYVLHCFQKKSKHGIKTPQRDIDLIKRRLGVAEEDYNTKYKRGE